MSDDTNYRRNVTMVLKALMGRLTADPPSTVVEVGVIPHRFRETYGASVGGSCAERIWAEMGFSVNRWDMADKDTIDDAVIGWDICEGPPPGRYDLCVVSEVLEHVADPFAAVTQLKGAAPVVLVTVPFLYPEHEPKPDLWRFTPDGLAELLRQGGFSEVETEVAYVDGRITNVGAVAR